MMCFYVLELCCNPMMMWRLISIDEIAFCI